MNPIFKYNYNTKYSTKDLKGGYKSKKFLVLDIYLKKERPVKIQFLNFFKDHQIMAKSGLTTVGYDEQPLLNALQTKFYNDHEQYKPKLNQYFQMH